jgi:hypothetical protein
MVSPNSSAITWLAVNETRLFWRITAVPLSTRSIIECSSKLLMPRYRVRCLRPGASQRASIHWQNS